MRTSHSPLPSRDSLRAGSRRARLAHRRGFTLVEVLTATALTLILMSLLAGVFAHVTDSVNNSRATIELNAQLTGVAYRLQKDLEGYTVRPDPLRKDFEDGYLEIMEGRIGTPFWGPRVGASGRPYEGAALNTTGAINDNTAFGGPDTTLADRDDIIMFTTRSRHEPFTGKFGDSSFSSEVAEVAWFVRGTTLYRRVLLVGAPTIPTTPARAVAWWELAQPSQPFVRTGVGAGAVFQAASPGPLTWNNANQNFYGFADLSVRIEGSPADLDSATRTAGGNVARLVPNTLASLALRQNRYAHPYGPGTYPHDARIWNLASGTTPFATPTGLGLPVMAESTHVSFPFPCLATGGYFTAGAIASALPTGVGTGQGALFDQLYPQGRYPMDNAKVDFNTGRMTTFDVPANDTNNFRRTNEDVILTNVIGFDIKVWDPGAPVFVKAGTTTVYPGDIHYPVLGNYSGQNSFPANMQQAVNGSNANYQLTGYGAYVNLGYAPNYVPYTPAAGAIAPPVPYFNGLGNPRSGLNGANSRICVYDTWTNAYGADGIDQEAILGLTPTYGVDQGTNGYDDNGTGGIDDENEREASPPYPFPLRGVQITLRVIEPGTQQVREVTVTQDFILE